MFYLKELQFRSVYLIVSFFFFFISFWYYKHFILIFFVLILQINGQFLFTHFIYTTPFEFLNIYLLLFSCLLIFYFFPFMLWQVIDFCKSSLYESEYRFFLHIFVAFATIFSIYNCLYYFLLLPNVLEFLFIFNSWSIGLLNFKIFYELKIIDYCYLVCSLLVVFNCLFIIGFCLYLYFFNLSINSMLFQKKLILLINIFLATFLSPPDVYTQLVYAFVLIFILEAFIWCKLLYFKSFSIFKIYKRKSNIKTKRNGFNI